MASEYLKESRINNPGLSRTGEGMKSKLVRSRGRIIESSSPGQAALFDFVQSARLNGRLSAELERFYYEAHTD